MLASTDEFKAITPSDTILLTYPNDQGDPITRKCKQIYVGSTGDLAVQNSAGVTVVHPNLLGGATYTISTGLILATGTTATGLIAYF